MQIGNSMDILFVCMCSLPASMSGGGVGRRQMLGVFLSHSPLEFLRQGFSLDLELADWLSCAISEPLDSLPAPWD